MREKNGEEREDRVIRLNRKVVRERSGWKGKEWLKGKGVVGTMEGNQK
jgi:hypothetical protein